MECNDCEHHWVEWYENDDGEVSDWDTCHCGMDNMDTGATPHFECCGFLSGKDHADAASQCKFFNRSEDTGK